MSIRSRENFVLKASAVAQGLALVTFPAESTVFLDPAGFDLTSTQYGFLFLPQAAAAIAASLLASRLVQKVGSKSIFFGGLLANTFALGLLVASRFLPQHSPLVYGVLLFATAFLGVGFGCVVPSLNTFTASFNPRGVDAAVLSLNALLGLGTVLAPVLVWIFVGSHIWWALPALVAGVVVALAAVMISLPFGLDPSTSSGAAVPKKGLGGRFLLYASFAVAYGICETINGNWAPLFMSSKFHAVSALAPLSLTAFWLGVTGGRVFFGWMGARIPQVLTFKALPWLLGLAFLALASVSNGAEVVAVLIFLLLGVGCSALLPLLISFGQKEFSDCASAVSGVLIGFYQMGYGLAAFGVDPLRRYLRISLPTMFGWASLAAVALAGLAFLMVRRSGKAHPSEK